MLRKFKYVIRLKYELVDPSIHPDLLHYADSVCCLFFYTMSPEMFHSMTFTRKKTRRLRTSPYRLNDAKSKKGTQIGFCSHSHTPLGETKACALK